MGCKPSTKSDYLDLWRRVLPPSYTDPIENTDEGQAFDVPSMQASIWERFEQAANTDQQAYFLKRHSCQTGDIAYGARNATTTLLVSRAAPNTGTITLPVGTKFRGSELDSYGRIYLLGDFLSTEAVTFAPGVAGPLPVPVAAEFNGYTGNLPAGQIEAFVSLGRADVPGTVITTSTIRETQSPGTVNDRFLSTMVGRYVRFSGANPLLVSGNGLDPRLVTAYSETGTTRSITFAPALSSATDIGSFLTVEFEEYSDLGFTVTQPDPSVGGRPDTLGAIGADRRQGRIPGETDEQFRLRLCSLYDNICPGAIERICGRVLGPYDLCFRLIETRDVQSFMGFTFDVHPYDLPGMGLACYQKTTGSDLIGQGIVYVGPTTSVRYFAVGVERGNQGEFGFPYDATNPLPTAPNAWDVGFYDGSPIGFDSLIGQLYESIDQARAAGVRFDIFIDPSACGPIALV